jgi:hypothetical protein
MPGDCSGTAGILLYDEIVSRNTSLDVRTVYDVKSTVKYNVYNGNQWMSVLGSKRCDVRRRLEANAKA